MAGTGSNASGAPVIPFFGIIVGAIVAIILANLISVIASFFTPIILLYYPVIVIGGIVGVRIDASDSLGRAILVGILIGIIAGLLEAYLIASLLPSYYATNINGISSRLISLSTDITAFAALVLYVIFALIGAIIGKLMLVNRRPGSDEPIKRRPIEESDGMVKYD